MNAWANGLVTAVISGGASAAAVVTVDPAHFSGEIQRLATVFAVGALFGLLNYLRQSPMPPKEQA